MLLAEEAFQELHGEVEPVQAQYKEDHRYTNHLELVQSLHQKAFIYPRHQAKLKLHPKTIKHSSRTHTTFVFFVEYMPSALD